MCCRDGQPVYISYKSQFKETNIPTPARNQRSKSAGQHGSRAGNGNGNGGAAGGGAGLSRSSKGKGSKQGQRRKGRGSGGKSSKAGSGGQQGAGGRGSGGSGGRESGAGGGGAGGGGQVGTWTQQGRNKVRWIMRYFKGKPVEGGHLEGLWQRLSRRNGRALFNVA